MQTNFEIFFQDYVNKKYSDSKFYFFENDLDFWENVCVLIRSGAI